MSTYVIEDSIAEINHQKTLYDRTYTDTNFYTGHMKRTSIPNKPSSNSNYYSQRKEALNQTLAKKRVVTNTKSSITSSSDLESILNLRYHPQSMITSYNKYSLVTKSNKHSVNNDKILTDLKQKHKEFLEEISKMKSKLKDNDEIVKKMFNDNSHLTNVNQLLLEELNEMKAKHNEMLSSHRIQSNKVNKENERLVKEIESLKQRLSLNSTKTDTLKQLNKKCESGKSSLNKNYIQKLTTTIESYKNSNKKYRLMIENLEETIDKLVKDNFQLSQRSNMSNNTNTISSNNKPIESSMTSSLDSHRKENREQIISALERENCALEAKVRELKTKLASIDNVKGQDNSCTSNINIEDNAILDSNDKDKEIGIIFHSLFDNLCHLLKKKKMTYTKCSTHKEELCLLIEEIQDDIQMMFIKKHYVDDEDSTINHNNNHYNNDIEINDVNDDNFIDNPDYNLTKDL